MKNGDRSRRDANTLRAALPIRRRTHRQRPRSRRATEQRDESPHSMTSSAMERTSPGMVRPRALAVLRLFPCTGRPRANDLKSNIQALKCLNPIAAGKKTIFVLRLFYELRDLVRTRKQSIR